MNLNQWERRNCLEDLSVVYLLLGPACNMTCRHCVQTPIKNTFSCTPVGGEIAQDVVNFVVRWANLPPLRSGNSRRFYFWGGEPLLYWETIKSLVEKFESLGVGELGYRIFTNGLLLNDEIIDYANEHNIWIIMSHDAPNATAVRNTVPSDEKCELLLKANKRTVNAVFSALNDDIVNTLDYLENKFPNTEITVGFINVLSEMPADIYAFKEGRVARAIERLAEKASNGDKHAKNWFNRKVMRGGIFNKREFEKYPFPPCCPGLTSLSMDFKGNIMRCHNDNFVIAHISEAFEDIQAKHIDVWRELLPKNCVDCECLSMCRCCCPIALQTEDKSELVYCDFLREFWGKIKEVGFSTF